MPDPTPPPGVELLTGFDWKNYGTNLSARVGTLYRLSNGPSNEPNVGLKAIQWAVRQVAAAGGSGSVSGSRWSFSAVAMNPAAMFDVRAMANQLLMQPGDLMNPAEASSLVQVQAGTTVQQLIRYAEAAGRDLKFMGGNCGQTIAGAIATGTKGGFTGQKGFADVVRALYLVGETGRRFWLERASRPVLSAALEAIYSAANVTVRRDDALFNHAVVSLGAFGLVYAVVLETAPAYSVKLSRKAVDFDDAVDRATFDRDFGGPEPLDYATVVNPYRMQRTAAGWRGSGAAVTTTLTLAPGVAPTPPDVGPAINDADLAPLLAQLAGAVPAAVAPLVGVLMNALYPPREAAGPMSCAYPLALTHAPTLSMELGVPSDRAREVFGAMLDFVQTAAVAYPGVIAIRHTVGSDATLSMARWPATTTFELGCLLVSQTEELLTGMLDALERQALPFSLHLGMLLGKSWLTRGRFEAMYGGAATLDAWRAARALTCPTGTLFSNALTKDLGLTT